MITIFTNPRPFRDHFDIIQRNAIKSWLKFSPRCQIILFNDEENTTSKVAKEFGLKCISDVAANEFGTFLLDDVFAKVKKAAKFEILAQVNTDIILMNNFMEAIAKVKRLMRTRPFFMTGRRWDLDLGSQVQFDEADWKQKLHERIAKEGKLHSWSGMDYWIFPRNFPINLPPFVVGRPGMDSWLVYKARSLKIPVIDATKVVTVVHQNHNYPQKNKKFFEIERKRNFKLAGGSFNMMNLRDANWILTSEGLKKPEFLRGFFSKLSLFYPWRLLRSIGRKIRKAF